MTQTLTEGDLAPNFTMETTQGTVTLADFEGQWLVLYFYPKDNTPGCTTEALDFSSLAEAFAAKNATVLGVSPDSLKSHDNFIAKKDLTVRLGSDLDQAVSNAYGVWVEKNMYGRKYMGVQRATFLISGDQRIAKIWPKVKVKAHAEDVLSHIS